MRLSGFVDVTLPIGYREAQEGVQVHQIAGISNSAKAGGIADSVIIGLQYRIA